eukprot:6209793-Pleurochrysis_carterae.AAC.1
MAGIPRTTRAYTCAAGTKAPLTSSRHVMAVTSQSDAPLLTYVAFVPSRRPQVDTRCSSCTTRALARERAAAW